MRTSAAAAAAAAAAGGAGGGPITRNLSEAFLPLRARRISQTKSGPEQVGHRLLDLDEPPTVIGASSGTELEVGSFSLPPEWMSCAEDAREDMKVIREKIVQLTKLQNKRLLKVFIDDSQPDKEVEAISSHISSLCRRCEQHIHLVKTRGTARDASQKEQQCRENAQRSLATQLQQLSQSFRQSQKDYLAEIRKRQQGNNVWDDGPDDPSPKGGGASANALSSGELQELEAMEFNARQRSGEICQIASSINDLHTIFKELAVLVIDQGSILDRIDYNIEQVVVQSEEANRQLQKANKSQKSNRAMKCIMVLVVVNLVLLIILVVKSRT